ncbi:hypothetical protein RI054_13g64880 [Pseudoscourfieldia marina]
MSHGSAGGVEVIATVSDRVRTALDQLGDVGDALTRPLAAYLQADRLEKHNVLFIGYPHGQLGNLISATPAQRVTRYRQLAHALIQLDDEGALGVDDGVDGQTATTIGSALMSLHMELQAAEPPKIVVQLPAQAAAAASDEKSAAAEEKAMLMTTVESLLDAAALIYQRRWGTAHLPPCRFMAAIMKAIMRVKKTEAGEEVTWYSYPTQNDATKVTHAKSTMLATMSTTAPIATMHLGRGANNLAEFQEREGEVLRVEGAKIDDIVDCFHRKQMPIILLSAACSEPREACDLRGKSRFILSGCLLGSLMADVVEEF